MEVVAYATQENLTARLGDWRLITKAGSGRARIEGEQSRRIIVMLCQRLSHSDTQVPVRPQSNRNHVGAFVPSSQDG